MIFMYSLMYIIYFGSYRDIFYLASCPDSRAKKKKILFEEIKFEVKGNTFVKIKL